MNRQHRPKARAAPPLLMTKITCVPDKGCKNCGQWEHMSRNSVCSSECAIAYHTRHEPAAANRHALEASEVYTLDGDLEGYVCSGCDDVKYPIGKVRAMNVVSPHWRSMFSCVNHYENFVVLCEPCASAPREVKVVGPASARRAQLALAI